MTDSGTTAPNNPDDASGPRWGIIAVVVLVIAAVIVAAVVLLGGGDDDEDDAATNTTADTTTVDSTTVDSTMPASETSVARGTTAPAAVETTDAPPATEAPDTSVGPLGDFVFTVEGTEDGGTIPVEFTCDGDGTAPRITIDTIPDEVLQLAFTVTDASSPTEYPYVQWVVYNIPGSATEIVADDDDLTFGINDAGEEGWDPPCPPEGDDPHNYVFTMYGMSEVVDLKPEMTGNEMIETIEQQIVDEVLITATYGRDS